MKNPQPRAVMKDPQPRVVMKDPQPQAVMASTESSWLVAERRALVMTPWPPMRRLDLRRPEPPEPDRSRMAFVMSPACLGLIATFAMTICAQIDGVQGTLLGLCLAFAVLYLGWRRDQD